MSVEEEIKEHAEHAREPFDKIVAATMAGIAALLALISVLGQHYTTETIINQELASDQWSFYQAKDIRRYIAQSTFDSLAAGRGGDALARKYAEDAGKYRAQADAVEEKARDYEKERKRSSEVARRFDFGEVFLEIAIVFSSLAILTKRRPFFVFGVGSALAGLVIAVTAYWA
ncbi:MAG TPA: DUF4337 domain-containing protein [Bryobacteraceae bacterium]|jgi:hypothetical protein|nr:DUF4337 domain-containing protein [Bryobacteraceae bacterium]